VFKKGDELLVEKTVDEREVFSGDLLKLTVNKVSRPDGSEGKREVVHHPGGVVIMPVLSSTKEEEVGEEEVLMVKQYREPAGQTLWEFPAGTLEEGESSRECARRELIEETGYRPASLEKRVDLFTSPGYSNEVLTLYLAKELEKIKHSEEIRSPEDENLVVERFEVGDLIKLADKGRIRDGKTLAGLFFLTCAQHAA